MDHLMQLIDFLLPDGILNQWLGDLWITTQLVISLVDESKSNWWITQTNWAHSWMSLALSKHYQISGCEDLNYEDWIFLGEKWLKWGLPYLANICDG